MKNKDVNLLKKKKKKKIFSRIMMVKVFYEQGKLK